MKRLLIYLSCFLLVGGSGTVLQSCGTWEVPVENTLSINKGIVAYLSFTKGSLKDSLIATDQRKNNTPTWGNVATKPTFVKGFSDMQNGSDSAILFNGKGDFISLQDNPTLQFKTHFSISLWIQPDIKQLTERVSDDAMQIYHKSAYDGLSNESYSTLLRRVKTSIKYDATQPFTPPVTTLMIRSNIKMENTKSICDTAGRGWQTASFIVNPSIIETNSWHHIVFTYTEKYVSIYLDGNLLDNFPLEGGQIQSCPGGDLRFGMEDKPYPSFFKGAVDEIRIYNRQLTEREVKSLYGLKNVTK